MDNGVSATGFSQAAAAHDLELSFCQFGAGVCGAGFGCLEFRRSGPGLPAIGARPADKCQWAAKFLRSGAAI